MPHSARTGRAHNTLVQATILKKCDRTWHKPGSNRGCAAGSCQHTCEAWQVPDCPHKWTVRYSVNSRQREQSFGTLDEAQTFQLTLSTGKRVQGAMFTDPRAGIARFLPLAEAYIEGMARAGATSRATYRSNFAHPAVTALLRDRTVVEVARMDAEVKVLLNKTLGGYNDNYRRTIRRVITGTLDEAVRKGMLARHTLTGIELAPRIVTAEQYERDARLPVFVTDDDGRGSLADGITVTRTDTTGRARTWVLPGLGIAPWLQRTMGLRIREALGVRKADFRTRGRRDPVPAPVLAGQPERPRAGTAQAPQSRRLPRRARPGPGLGHDPAAAGRAAVPRPGRHPLPALRHRQQQVRPHLRPPGHRRCAHPQPAPPVRQRSPGHQPPRTGQHLPGPGPRQCPDHAAVLQRSHRQRRTADRCHDEHPLGNSRVKCWAGTVGTR